MKLRNIILVTELVMSLLLTSCRLPTLPTVTQTPTPAVTSSPTVTPSPASVATVTASATPLITGKGKIMEIP